MSAASWLRTAAVVLVALVVQQTVLAHIRAGGTHPDDMFLVSGRGWLRGRPG